jgi:hypothetical protein
MSEAITVNRLHDLIILTLTVTLKIINRNIDNRIQLSDINYYI